MRLSVANASFALLCCLLFTPLLGCGSEPSDFCAQAAEDHAACVDDNVLGDCEEAVDTCPGRVRIAESCPVQFSCPAEG